MTTLPTDEEFNKLVSDKIDRTVFFSGANGAAAVGFEVQSDDDGLRHTTICILILKSGLTVVGKSRCIDHDGFDQTQANQVAFDDAFLELSRHCIYELAESIHAKRTAIIAPRLNTKDSGAQYGYWMDSLMGMALGANVLLPHQSYWDTQYAANKTPQQAFYDYYPEHKPK